MNINRIYMMTDYIESKDELLNTSPFSVLEIPFSIVTIIFI